MRKVLAMLLVVAAMMLMVACGGKGSSAVGTYKIKSMTSGGQTMTAEEMQALYDQMGVEEKVEDMMSVELQDGGKIKVTLMDEAQEGTYKIDGEKLTITVDGESLECSLKNGEITMSMEDETVVFAK